MRIYNYFAALLLSVSILASCSKNSGIDEPVVPQPQDPEKPTATLPNITFGKAVTKAMMNDADLKYNGNKIRVYDLLSNFTGTITGWNGTDPYIYDEIEYNGSEIWKYVSNGIYPWTATGIHKFFGWLTYDKKSNLNVTDLVTPTLSGTTLTVPAITFNATTPTPQFDFMYSDLVQRDAADKNFSVVPLNFKHLFTALSVQVENNTDVEVKLKSITFDGLKNKNSATIAFAETSTATLGTSSIDGSFFPTMGTSDVQTLVEGESYDVLTKTHSTGTNPIDRTFFMLWPQAASDVSPTNEETDPARRAQGYEYLSTDSLILMSYELYIDNHWESRTTRMKLPNMAWEAGKKVHFSIVFSDKMIQLTAKVIPWDYNEYDMDYSDASLVVPTGLKFDAGTCSISGNVATVVSGKNPKGTFQIVSPANGTWRVALTGDVDYFTISPESGIIDPSGTASSIVTLVITPNLSLDRPTDKQVKLKFSVVTPSGRELDANSDINRDDWIILLPKN